MTEQTDHAIRECLEAVCAAFGLGSLVSVDPIEVGLIQATWRVETQTQQGQDLWIVQRLHPVFGPGVTADGAAVTEHLRQAGIPVPQYVRTTEGDWHWHQEGRLWRVMGWMPGSSHAVAPDPDYLRAAGRVVGRIHRALQDWDYSFQFGIPHFHDTAHILGQLEQVHPQLARNPDAAALGEKLLNLMPEMLLPPDGPTQVIHGDLKLTNFLFDAQGSLTAVLDWDTCMRHSLYVELGDALRSWTMTDAGINLPYLAAAWQGYQSEAEGIELDPQLIWQGMGVITLELAARFLIDVVEDCYWHWDPQHYPSRQAHNLARCRRQMERFAGLVQQRDPVLAALGQVSRGNV